MPLETIASFEIPSLQILDPAGEVDSELEPHLTDEQLLAIYRTMVLAREADERMLKLQRQGRIGTFGPSTGQEAATVGPAYAMGDDDWFVGSFRELGGRLARGEPLVNQLRYWSGLEEGNVQPEGVDRLLPMSVIVAAQNLHAVGIAYAMQYRKQRSAVVTFFGDGATSQGDFHEALNLAAVWRSPVVFVCQNNQWAISHPRARQTASQTLAQKALAYDIPGIQVDGNDVLAMYHATAQALERAYSGEGPTLIEAVTYRLMMHTTADDPSKYRTKQEEQAWWEKDPLTRFARYLRAKGVWDDDQEQALRNELREQVEQAVQLLETPHDLKPDAPFDHVFATPPPHLEEQRRHFLTELQRETADA